MADSSAPGSRPELPPYSFQDVLALRAFVVLRKKGVPLPNIRTTLAALPKCTQAEHLDRCSLPVLGPDDDPTDLVKDLDHRPITATMADILAEFTPRPGVVVPHLLRPRPHVRIDPGTQGGQPVVTGTHVPSDAVAELVAEGIPPEEIAAYYPGVTADAAHDAMSFARYVDGYARSQPVHRT
jgi:uncharacterized protein (DUF433 family)